MLPGHGTAESVSGNASKEYGVSINSAQLVRLGYVFVDASIYYMIQGAPTFRRFRI